MNTGRATAREVELNVSDRATVDVMLKTIGSGDGRSRDT